MDLKLKLIHLKLEKMEVRMIKNTLQAYLQVL